MTLKPLAGPVAATRREASPVALERRPAGLAAPASEPRGRPDRLTTAPPPLRVVDRPAPRVPRPVAPGVDTGDDGAGMAAWPKADRLAPGAGRRPYELSTSGGVDDPVADTPLDTGGEPRPPVTRLATRDDTVAGAAPFDETVEVAVLTPVAFADPVTGRDRTPAPVEVAGVTPVDGNMASQVVACLRRPRAARPGRGTGAAWTVDQASPARVGKPDTSEGRTDARLAVTGPGRVSRPGRLADEVPRHSPPVERGVVVPDTGATPRLGHPTVPRPARPCLAPSLRPRDKGPLSRRLY